MLQEAGGEDHEARWSGGRLRREQDSRLLAATQRMRVGSLDLAKERVEFAGGDALVP